MKLGIIPRFVGLLAGVLVCAFSCKERERNGKLPDLEGTVAIDTASGDKLSHARAALEESIAIQTNLYRSAAIQLASVEQFKLEDYSNLFDTCIERLIACYSKLEHIDGLTKQDMDSLFSEMEAKTRDYEEASAQYRSAIQAWKGGDDLTQVEYKWKMFKLEQEGLIRRAFNGSRDIDTR